MSQQKKILIIGGYGKVGSNAAFFLISKGLSVVIAGRNLKQAESLAKKLGLLAEARLIDVEEDHDLDMLKDVTTVLMCVDQSTTDFAILCLENGINYVDVSATDAFHQDVEKLRSSARTNHALALLSVGLAPGISNLLAKQLSTSTGFKNLNIGILLGTGEKHGKAAIDWTLRSLFEANSPHRSKRMSFGQGIEDRLCIPFPFSDQFSLVRSGAVLSATTRMCLESRSLTFLAMCLAAIPGVKYLWKAINLLPLARIINGTSFGSDVFALTVSPEGQKNVYAGLVGHNEGRLTGRVAGRAVELANSSSTNGVFHLHEQFKLNDFMDLLIEEGVKFEKTGH